MSEQVLVSVVLSCYNHEAYIVQAMESIAAQAYPRKELIVTDDGSTDASVEVVRRWLAQNAGRFERAELVTSIQNTGITYNINRGFAAATGSLVKILAADDLLRAGCLEGMAAEMERTAADIAFCYEVVFRPHEQALLGTTRETELERRPGNVGIFELPQQEMYKALLRANIFPAPAAMIRKSCYEALGGFDNRYRFTEDYPFWLKALRQGKKIVFANLVGVYYRKTEDSISWRAKAEPTLAQIRFQECLYRLVSEVRNPEMRRLGMTVTVPPEPDDSTASLQGSAPAGAGQNPFLRKAKKAYWWGRRLAGRVLRWPKTAAQRLAERLKIVAFRLPLTGFKQFLRHWLRRLEFSRAAPMAGETRRGQNWRRLYRQARQLEAAYATRLPQPQKTILFAVHLLSVFSAVESIWLAARAAPGWQAVLLLMPGRQPGMDQRFAYDAGLEAYMQAHGYPYQLAYENGIWHHVLEWQPDVLFYQTPYFHQRHPLYNFRYAAPGPRVCYTPYGPWVMDRSVEDYIKIGIDRPYFDGLWRIYADKLTEDILRDEAPGYLPITVRTGTPKVDFYRMGTCVGSYCWNLPAGAGKRVIWMPRWGIEAGHSSFPNYYKYFLWLLRRRPDIDFVLRPHPLLLRDLVRSGYMTAAQRDAVMAAFEALPNASIDHTADYRAGLLSCDLLISDYSSVIYEYLPAQKPLIYTRKANTLLDEAIQQGCYCADTLDELMALLEPLLQGEDPLRGQHALAVAQLAYFEGEGLNGERIFDDIRTHIDP